MTSDNADEKEKICSESCLGSYFAAINGILLALLLLLIAVLTPVSGILQKKVDRKKAEAYYDSYISRDGDNAIRHNTDQSELFPSFLLRSDPDIVIRKGRREGKSRDEIIEDLIAAEEDNRWFGRLEYDNLASDMIRWAILTVIAVIMCFPMVYAAVMTISNRRYVIVEGGMVSLSSKASVALRDVIRAETGSLKKVTIVTDNRRYKRRFIRNNFEIAEFINEHCNNAAQ